ncbi:MAG: beta-galactosidase [Clostridium sp.]|uniref:glycoside hydrolase family 35 protein n=1 Tax=Clostridium sp. TaxID=1506 RepID=UPI00302934E1
MQFKIQGNKFLKGENEVKIISGAIHYFRMFKEQYMDRLLKLKACGFNTVETYVAWNLHEPKKGEFVFSSYFDLEEFIKIADEIGLMVIVRPGPYICAEWEFGGFPSWLLKDKNIKLRCNSKEYLKHVDSWFDELIPILIPYLCTNGGPIIAVQVENEYGSYGDDKDYLKHIRDGLVNRGVDIMLFTSDGPTDFMLKGGTLEGVYKTANFGSRPKESFDMLEKHQKDMPLMCMEWWIGWFDHWQDIHHRRDGEEIVKILKEMLDRDVSVNFYMFHGGTNFGFMNGANFTDKYMPTTTSYDYDSLLTEAGDITDKYLKVREVIESSEGKITTGIPKESTKKAYGTIKLNDSCGLFESLEGLATPIINTQVENMEVYDQDYGYILYSKKIDGPMGDLPLTIQDVHDRAQIFIDGEEVAVQYRNREIKLKSDKLKVENSKLILQIPKDGIKLDILVENMGRINYGPYIKDFKGITEGIRIQGQFLFGVDVWNLDMKDLSGLKFKKNNVKESCSIDKNNNCMEQLNFFEKAEEQMKIEVLEESKISSEPRFYRGNFNIESQEDIGDTFISLDNFNKGIIFINGFNLGRYWQDGPQLRLYLPYPLLKVGENEIIVFEQHGCSDTVIELVGEPKFK